jgi:DNA helicase II / ATP-dependent DNA helicase PcrA
MNRNDRNSHAPRHAPDNRAENADTHADATMHSAAIPDFAADLAADLKPAAARTPSGQIRVPADAAPHSHAPAAMHEHELLAGLTDPQKRAVLHERGPCLVLAAAGSGKTRVITRRIARLISRGAAPWSILALTFTNKAAGEMRERVHTVLGHDPRYTRGLTVTTFHALCARLLRRYAEDAHLKTDFTIYDSSDQMSLVKKVLEALQLSTTNWPPRSVLSAISTAKNDLVDAERYKASATDFYTKTIANIYAGYQESLRKANAVDFDDLLVLTAKMLRESASVRDACQQRWRHLLIDEYQDTNRAQFVIASLIAGTGSHAAAANLPPGVEDDDTPASTTGSGLGPNIFVVGDPDQAIYGWRGADITNILDFEQHYPSAVVIPLGENFRSTTPILAVADTLIRNNKQRKHKDLFTRRAGGEKVEIVLCREEQHEATMVVDWVKRLHEAGEISPSAARNARRATAGSAPGSAAGSTPAPASDQPPEPVAWKDMAVFYRTNALSRVLEDAFRAAAIPYIIARGTAFYEREEIKNALAYLRVVANAADSVSLERIVNVPPRGLGDSSLAVIENFAAAERVPLLEALRRSRELEAVSSRAQNAADRFIAMLDSWTGGGTFMGASISGSLADLVSRVIKESGLEGMYKKLAETGKSDADEARLENLDELISSARQFELEFDPAADPAQEREADGSPSSQVPPLLAMLRAYLESVTLVADADEIDPAQGAVTLMTLHAAKGLEFRAAAIVGLEEGLLPHSRALEAASQMEEERRLFFVGITRAMRRLLVTSAAYRTFRGMPERTIPSRFLDELGNDHVRVSDRADTMSGLEDTAWDDAQSQDVDTPRTSPRAPAPSASATRASNSGPRFVPDEAAPFAPGNVVRHPQFGEGVVVTVTVGPSARAKIRFRSVGEKTLVLEYARLTRVR